MQVRFGLSFIIIIMIITTLFTEATQLDKFNVPCQPVNTTYEDSVADSITCYKCDTSCGKGLQRYADSEVLDKCAHSHSLF